MKTTPRTAEQRAGKRHCPSDTAWRLESGHAWSQLCPWKIPITSSNKSPILFMVVGVGFLNPNVSFLMSLLGQASPNWYWWLILLMFNTIEHNLVLLHGAMFLSKWYWFTIKTREKIWVLVECYSWELLLESFYITEPDYHLCIGILLFWF